MQDLFVSFMQQVKRIVDDLAIFLELNIFFLFRHLIVRYN